MKIEASSALRLTGKMKLQRQETLGISVGYQVVRVQLIARPLHQGGDWQKTIGIELNGGKRGKKRRNDGGTTDVEVEDYEVARSAQVGRL